MISLAPSPLTLLESPLLLDKEIKLYLKRDDLLHPEISGNKWRKLKYNLIDARTKGYDSLVTFGGAFSNHIYATAAAGKVFGFKTYGIIRGEELSPSSSPTLAFAKSCGMDLQFVSRTAYRDKNALIEQFPKHLYVVPEGGSSQLALEGVREMAEEIYAVLHPDYICASVGTGGTLAGIISGLKPNTKAIGFLALKGVALGMRQDIQDLIGDETLAKNFELNEDFHFGGYAKYTAELIDFIKNFEQQFPPIQLEQVYTGKLLYGIFQLIQQDYFKKGSTIVCVHTGGLQGRCTELMLPSGL